MDTIEIHHPEWDRTKRIYPTARSIEQARKAGWTVPVSDVSDDGEPGDTDPPDKPKRTRRSRTAETGN